MKTHKTNFGRYGSDLPCDLDGYTYTTAPEWLRARIDGTPSREWALEQAARARASLAVARMALREWQQRNP